METTHIENNRSAIPARGTVVAFGSQDPADCAQVNYCDYKDVQRELREACPDLDGVQIVRIMSHIGMRLIVCTDRLTEICEELKKLDESPSDEAWERFWETM